MPDSPYRQYLLLGKPLFAVPEQPGSLRRLGLQAIHAHTPRRRAAKRLFHLAQHLHLDKLSSRPLPNPFGDASELDFEAWHEDVRRRLNLEGSASLILWPPQEHRSRAYVHLLGKALTPVAFAKVVYGSCKSQHRGLEREAAALKELSPTSTGEFRVPKLLDYTQGTGHCTLVSEPIPMDAAPPGLRDENLLLEYVTTLTGPGYRLSSQELSSLSWWNTFSTATDDTPFLSNLLAILPKNISLSRCHGDLGLSNCLQSGDTTWIFDWETSRSDAPVLTDSIGLHLSKRLRKTLVNPQQAVLDFKQKFLTPFDQDDKFNALFALAFRHTCQVPDAIAIIENWDS